MINKVPELIRELEEKEQRKVLQKEIAEGASIHQSTLSRIVRGHIDAIHFETVAALGEFFSDRLKRKIDVSDMFTLEYEQEPA